MGIIWCSVLFLWTVVGAKVSTSGYKLSLVCRKEGQLVEVLDRYVTLTLTNQSHVDEYVQSFLGNVKEERSKIKDINAWIGHPINAYHLVKRTVDEWGKVQQSISCSTCVSTTAAQEFHSSWKRIIDRHGVWTSSDDVIIAVQGLARLYETYDLDVKSLMSGTILNTNTSPLTTADGISIAKYVEKEHKATWIEALLELDDITEKEALLYDLAMTYHMLGRSQKALGILTDLQQTSTRSMTGIVKLVRQAAEKPANVAPLNKRKAKIIAMDSAYRKLCQGNIQTNQETPVLHCYNKVTRIPYYTVKEEVLNYVPRISRFHDVISVSEMSHLQDIAKQHLTPAMVVGWNGKTALKHTTRTGEKAWIDTSVKISVQLETRIQLLSGLAALTSEVFEVVNYGLGGHYLRHYDSLDLEEQKNIDRDYSFRDRIATWMFYLSNVEAGGATVFPALNLRIPPIKGSAVLWYNLLPSGARDERSAHASCPVLLGSKWIATKWILEYGQEFGKPCKRNPMDEHF